VSGTITEPQVRTLGEVRKGYTHFADGDVISAKITPCMENGKSASVRGMTNGLACGTTEFYVFRSRGALDQDFLFQFIRQESYRKAARATMQSGVGQARVPKEFVLNTELPVPPLAEQRRIVAKIEAWQERSQRAREALSEVGPLLEQFRQSVLAAAFRGDLTADWRAAHPNVKPASELLHHSRADLGKVKTRRGVPKDVSYPDHFSNPVHPPSWYFTSVGDLLHLGALIDVKDGNHGAKHPRTSEFTPEGLPFITASQVLDYRLDYETAPKVLGEPLAKLQVGFAEVGDVVLTHKGTVGRTAINTEPCVLTPQTTYYRCREACIDPMYLMYYLSSPVFQEQLASVMSQTTRNFVPISEQYRLFLLVPPIDEQHAIAAILDASLDRLRELAEAAKGVHAQLDQFNQAILAKAFRGELVPQDPNDEPASVLLDRIRKQRAQQAEVAKARKKTAKTQPRNGMIKKSSGLASQQQPKADVQASRGQSMASEQLWLEY
jgi:type I restriction enzyme S subunit